MGEVSVVKVVASGPWYRQLLHIILALAADGDDETTLLPESAYSTLPCGACAPRVHFTHSTMDTVHIK